MNNAEILKQIIESRKSIFPKDYTGEPIPKNILDDIMNSVTFAPNHKRTKPWRFQLFQGEENRHIHHVHPVQEHGRVRTVPIPPAAKLPGLRRA